MKYPALIAVFFFSLSICAADDRSNSGYRLIWADEFAVDGAPDATNWTFENGFVRNHELQWYQRDNASCENGILVIEGRREVKPNPDYQRGNRNWKKQRKDIQYTSSCLTTKGIHSWKYGRFEVKARIKTDEGLWPAIWFLGVDGRWPSNGEIDLMEYYGGDLLANACWGGTPRGRVKWDQIKKPVVSFPNPKWDQSFHVWRMDWDSKQIKLYVDDILLNTIDLAETINVTDQGPRNPFRQPHYLLLNLAIGGSAGGDPSLTVFPTRLEIDYVRVYQKEARQ